MKRNLPSFIYSETEFLYPTKLNSYWKESSFPSQLSVWIITYNSFTEITFMHVFWAIALSPLNPFRLLSLYLRLFFLPFPLFFSTQFTTNHFFNFIREARILRLYNSSNRNKLTRVQLEKLTGKSEFPILINDKPVLFVWALPYMSLKI